MANSNTPQANQVSTPSMSSRTPLQLSGFLAGDTIRVHGDTGELRFSVKLNINKKLFPENPDPPVSPDPIACDTEELPGEGSGFESEFPVPGEMGRFSGEEEGVRTRLRSGAIVRVKYFPWVRVGRRTGVGAGRGRRRMEAVERVLRRRSFPVRPCSSYGFFVMDSWASVNASSSSFGETSKRVSRMWSQLPSHKKKVYEEMGLKDNARYKWQSQLFINNNAHLLH